MYSSMCATPERLMEDIRHVLRPRGTLIASVPNFGHWYARGRTALGLFDYDQRGVLDAGHVRFFTRRGFLRRLQNAGLSLTRCEATGVPMEALTSSDALLSRIVRDLDRIGIALRPTLFGYQFVVQCESPVEPSILETAPAPPMSP